jgi:phage baseplate assembly protein W
LQRWEPRIDILRLDADCNAADPGRMDIMLEYRVRRTLHQDGLVLPLQLSLEEG